MRKIVWILLLLFAPVANAQWGLKVHRSPSYEIVLRPLWMTRPPLWPAAVLQVEKTGRPVENTICVASSGRLYVCRSLWDMRDGTFRTVFFSEEKWPTEMHMSVEGEGTVRIWQEERI